MDYLVGFFSYKGGVGRTVVLCNTALALLQQLRNKGADHGVFCVDLDLSAPGLLPIFGLSWRGPSVLEGTLRGLVDRPLKDDAVQLSVSGRPVPLRIVAEKGPNRGLLSALNALFTEEADPDQVQLLLRYFKDRGRRDFLAPYTLLDLGAGLGELSLEAFGTLDHLVLVVRGDRQHRKALPVLLKNIRQNWVDRLLLPWVHVVLNQVPTDWAWVEENPPDKEAFLQESGLTDFLTETTGQRKTLEIVPLVESCLTGEVVFLPEGWNYSETSEDKIIRLPANDAETRYRDAVGRLARNLLQGADA